MVSGGEVEKCAPAAIFELNRDEAVACKDALEKERRMPFHVRRFECDSAQLAIADRYAFADCYSIDEGYGVGCHPGAIYDDRTSFFDSSNFQKAAECAASVTRMLNTPYQANLFEKRKDFADSWQVRSSVDPLTESRNIIRNEFQTCTPNAQFVEAAFIQAGREPDTGYVEFIQELLREENPKYAQALAAALRITHDGHRGIVLKRIEQRLLEATTPRKPLSAQDEGFLAQVRQVLMGRPPTTVSSSVAVGSPCR